MDTIKELTSSIRDYLRDRTSNPIYGAFVVAWIAVNFRALVILFGDGPARDKLRLIDSQLYPREWDGAWYGFCYPLLLSVVFVLFSPFVRRWATVFIRGREKETVSQLLRIEGETPLTKAQADVLRQSIQSERERRLKDRDEANRQIDELRQQLDIAARDTRPRLQFPSEEVANPVVPTDNDTLVLFESDFVGVAQKTYILAAQRGLSRAQAELLYVLRNGDTLTVAEMATAMRFAEHHPTKVLVDQLRGLDMIEATSSPKGLAYQIKSGGTQALSAVEKRGFDAAASLARRRES